MPIYEFQCECGKRFEKLCRINEKESPLCPGCGGKTRRVMSLFRTPGSGDSSSGGGCGPCSSSSCSSCGC